MAQDRDTCPAPIVVTDLDIYEAMKDVEGFLDITPSDLKVIYTHAYHHALDRIRHSLKATDIMSTSVFTTNPGTPLMEAASLMAANRVSGLPVVDEDGHVLGILSEKDFFSLMGKGKGATALDIIALCLSGTLCAASELRKLRAKDAMTSPAITVGMSAYVEDIAALFDEKKINRAPVVEEGGRLVGIITRTDIIRRKQARNI